MRIVFRFLYLEMRRFVQSQKSCKPQELLAQIVFLSTILCHFANFILDEEFRKAAQVPYGVLFTWEFWLKSCYGLLLFCFVQVDGPEFLQLRNVYAHCIRIPLLKIVRHLQSRGYIIISNNTDLGITFFMSGVLSWLVSIPFSESPETVNPMEASIDWIVGPIAQIITTVVTFYQMGLMWKLEHDRREEERMLEEARREQERMRRQRENNNLIYTPTNGG